ncbi:hypothetical protein H0H87_009186 [Tephrocybe sp. NHM501043]|nr:hypothetical protein H0H87_009186 [Tephrocybe sp. NHM501043]
MLLATSRHKPVFLLDFLAPSLLYRAAHRSSPHQLHKRTPPSSPQRSAEPHDTFKKPRNFAPSLRGLEPAQVDTFKEAQTRLASACEKNDAYAVAIALKEFDGWRTIHLLPPAQIDVSLQLFLSALSAGKLKSSDEEWFTRFALRAATSSSSSFEALSALMLLRLQQKNLTAVIELYEKFMESLRSKEIWDSDQGQEEKDHEDFNLKANSLVSDEHMDLRVETGRMSLLLAVTAAHAMREDFQAALETCLKTAIRFHGPSLESFLATNFGQDEAFAVKLKRFVARLDIARLVARPSSLSRHIINLASASSIKPLDGLYKSIVNGLLGPDAYIAADPSMKTSKKTVALTDIVWLSFVSAFLKRRRRDLASKIWTDQTTLGITPGVAFWTTLIDAYGSMNELDDAIAAWNMMKAEHIQPDALTYRALISAFFKGRKSTEAMKIFQAFQKQPPKDVSEAHLLSIYNTTIDGLLSFNQEDAVKTLLLEMEKRGPKPDIVTYNTVLAYYGRRENIKGLARLVGRMAELKVVGDVYTFSTLLSALLKSGRDDAPDLLIDIMRKQGVQPNVATYSAIIGHQMRSPTVQRLKVVMRLLQRMEEDATALPNVKTYTAILAGLSRIEGADTAQIDEWWREIIERMKRHHVEPNQATYHFLIDACLKRESQDGLNDALQYYREMQKRGLMINTSWYLMLLGLLRRGSLGVAEEVIEDMLATGHRPTITVERLVAEITRRRER